MKKRRKFLAMLLATAMVMGSSMTTLAATGTVPGDTTITGSGNVAYVDTEVISVTLPTTAAMELTVDPQGISTLSNNSSASAEELEGAAGLISSTHKALVTNCSSVPVKVSVTLTGTGDATFMASANAVDEDSASANNILLYALPSAVDVGASVNKYVESTTGIRISNTSVSANFILDEAEYVFEKTGASVNYVKKADDPGHGTAIAFAGLVNKKADWSTYADGSKEIGMTAVFSCTADLGENDVADTAAGTPYGLMLSSVSGNTISVGPEEAAPSIAVTEYTLTAGTPVDITVDLGKGDLAATGVAKVMDPTGVFDYLAGNQYAVYDASAKKLTLKAAMVDACKSANVTSTDVIFNDEAKTKVKITFK